MKFTKKLKAILAAVPMLILSTAAAVTGTVAWFTASNIVSAEGMLVQAEKENGIVLNNESLANDNWKTSIKASHDGKVDDEQAKFIPTSSYNGTTWAHANAESASIKDANVDSYAVYAESQTTVNGSGTGVYQIDVGGVKNNIYLLNKLYLKSATTAPVTGTLYSYVKASVVGTNKSVELNKALRVLVKYEDAVNVYAPIADALMSYDICKEIVTPAVQDDPTTQIDEHVTAEIATEHVNALAGGQTNPLKANVTIPANNPDSPAINSFEVKVYVYFEGEETECYSNNITETLDQLSIMVKLGTQDNLA